MTMPRQIWLSAGTLAALLAWVAPGALHTQETGTIVGHVAEGGTNQPLAGVQMFVAGTNLGTITNREGRYVITNVPAGEHEVRATLIGYSAERRTVTVSPGASAVADFLLRQSAIELEGLVATATGRAQRRREVGSTVATINVEAVNLAPVQTFSQLLQGRAAAWRASAVPDAFAYHVEHSANSSGENNGLFIYSLNNGRYGVPDGPEGGTGLDWASDERTPVLVDPRAPFDTSLPIYLGPGKYPTRDMPVVLADGREARLIQAEAALRAGDVAGFVGYLNAARAQDGLGPLTAADVPGDDPGRVDAERGYAMWLTAHRLGDLRRLVRQYGRDPALVFPSDEFFRDGLRYGTDVNLPILVDENNNPNFAGCLNRDA
jgi:hypothetical protein